METQAEDSLDASRRSNGVHGMTKEANTNRRGEGADGYRPTSPDRHWNYEERRRPT